MSGDLTKKLESIVGRRGMQALLLYGPRASGKTLLASRMHEQWSRQGGAVAVFDLSSVRIKDERDQLAVESAVREIIAQLAWDLRVDCPRLIATHVAMGLTLPPADHVRARQMVLEEWLNYTGTSTRWETLADMAGGVVVEHVRPTLGEGTLKLAISNTVLWTLHSVARKALPPPLRWFADPHLLRTKGKSAKAALDTLCDLSVNAAKVDDIRAGRKVTKIQFLALLADLTSIWSSGTARHRTDQAVFLLDNVDTAVGRRFVAVWNEAWTALHARQQAGAVPLSLISTAQNPTPDMLEDSCWDAIRIRALTRDEVQQRARQRLGSKAGELVGALVHEATGGHRGTTEVLLDPRPWPPHNYRPADVLDSHLDGVRVEDRLLEKLLDPALGSQVTHLLCCCAVARRRTDAEALLSILVRSNDPTLPRVLQILDSLPLWTESGNRPTLLRRLLLRQLARANKRDDTWSRLHQRLIKNDADQAFYLMGMENARAAADRLVDELSNPNSGTLSVTNWIHRIHAAAMAPRATTLLGSSAGEQATTLRTRAAAVDGTQPAGCAEQVPTDPPRHPSRSLPEATFDLLILLAVASDPFRAVPRGELHHQVAAGYSELQRVLWDAGHHDNDGILPREMRTHTNLANDWLELEDTALQPSHSPQIT